MVYMSQRTFLTALSTLLTMTLVLASTAVRAAVTADTAGNAISQPVAALPTHSVTHEHHNAFFDQLKQFCGTTYAGNIDVDTSQSARFAQQTLLMHVRECEEDRILIPFHVGADHSRTWIISRTGFGLGLKHDHRQATGEHDALTMYGGHTDSPGAVHRQDFPVDAFSQAMLLRLGYPQSVDNVWSVFLYPDRFSYQLARPGMVFRVTFDLTKPVEQAPTPWGYAPLSNSQSGKGE